MLEVNVLLAAASLMTDEERGAKKKLPLMRQGQLMLKAMPKASRVAEFVALWTIAKASEGATTAEGVAEYWNQPPRTMYRRLEEFREVWSAAGHDTPDELADHLIADYRRRKQRIEASGIAAMLSAEVPSPPLDAAAVGGA